MIPVKVQKITYYHPNRSYAVILKELDGDRRLPVLIGAFEAQSIAIAMEYMETPRPLTHDLITNLIKGINANLTAVKIIKLKDGIFYSVLDIQSKKIGHREIDSRPSDALAIALRMHAPIFVSSDIMNESITLEKDFKNIEDEIGQEPVIEALEKQLEKAIEEEEYEVAAKIRDKIKKI